RGEPRLEQAARQLRLAHYALPQDGPPRIIGGGLAISVRELDGLEAGGYELLVQDGVIKSHCPALCSTAAARNPFCNTAAGVDSAQPAASPSSSAPAAAFEFRPRQLA